MDINKDSALRLWQRDYGNAQEAEDFAGREMIRENYGKSDDDGGWNIHHIYPKSRGGKTVEKNLLCSNIETNDDAGNKTTFPTNGRTFQVTRIKRTRTYKLVDITQKKNKKKRKKHKNKSTYNYNQNVNGGIVN